MGQKPYGSVGDRGRLIARLPGARDAYRLDQNGPDETALIYSLQPGHSVQSTSNPPSAPSMWRDAAASRQVARSRAEHEQRAARKMAAGITKFWEAQRHG
jgi:hypothetical protein